MDIFQQYNGHNTFGHNHILHESLIESTRLDTHFSDTKNEYHVWIYMSISVTRETPREDCLLIIFQFLFFVTNLHRGVFTEADMRTTNPPPWLIFKYMCIIIL